MKNGGFESGFTAPWGTGLYSDGKKLWWNSLDCQSAAEADEIVKKEGVASLHILNLSPRSPHVYGTVAERILIKKNQPYRITLWARGFKLASRGAINISVDDVWKVRPIAFPQGTFSWVKLDGVFRLNDDHADIRIISEDSGEAWIDDIQVVPLEEYLSK